MHRERKKLSWHRFEPCKLKNKENIFLSLFFSFFITFIFIFMVGAYVVHIIINIFSAI